MTLLLGVDEGTSAVKAVLYDADLRPLAEARRVDPDLPYLVALLAVHAASPGVGTAYRQGEERLLFAVDDGTRLDDEEFGGADLIVGSALLDAVGMAADRTEGA